VIIFHSVSKVLGRGTHRTTILDEVDWTIPPGTRVVIFGQAGAGKTTILNLIRGTSVPTSGWLERRAAISPAPGLSRFGKGFITPRNLIERLCPLFDVDSSDLCRFVEGFAAPHTILDVPLRNLQRPDRQALNLALFYGVPSDFYLFDGRILAAKGHLGDLCRAAFKQRSQTAGMILATDNANMGREFGGIGMLLHRGRLTAFGSAEDASAAFEVVREKDPLPRTHRYRLHEPRATEDETET
jgi:capsular polysaccharide transport system ATP-binding protein